MKILIVGATGTIGRAVTQTLRSDHEVLRASRNGDVRVDLNDADSISRMYASTGTVDAIISTAGSGQFGPLGTLSDEDFEFGFGNKVIGQINLVRYGLEHLSDGGSITLTSGILADRPHAGSVLITSLNSAVEGFVRAASLDMPRDIRLNVVSPPMVRETANQMGWVGGGVPANDVARLYSASVNGFDNGQVFSIEHLRQQLQLKN
jgi:NAD(P)-dependent dehydrogenase (short-subunit alcohol dehydrogenase family)